MDRSRSGRRRLGPRSGAKRGRQVGQSLSRCPYITALPGVYENAVWRSAHAWRGRVLAEEVLADDLLLDRLLADVARPLATVGAQGAAAAVDVLGRVHGRLDGALHVGDLGVVELAGDRAVVLDVLLDDLALGSGADEELRAGGQRALDVLGGEQVGGERAPGE